ncbi:hypothetical protein RZS28_18735 (plasmid) [Methylocapsa polymorpha]|uniref:Uncharacterized protein n=1 Tax=Methylocapsa polymorpha TaxID=3080828 RepID=A0ABZ0HXV7_9HYPH|nr:hypothetical protein [Methylocapsa sp. RX1]WOJ91766.1 hypothetical protein RZS28_18735 [Methylocapsa sp. RX1]
MLDLATFQTICNRLAALGFLQDDVAWSEASKPPTNADDFALEAIFVICNSGMKNTVARRIFEKVRDALCQGRAAGSVFGHVGKSAAMDRIWRDREMLLTEFLAAEDKLAWCASLPWIGEITKYHLAKNFGADVAKPDVHLQRLADAHGVTPHELCADLAVKTGYRIPTIDLLLWGPARMA